MMPRPMTSLDSEKVLKQSRRVGFLSRIGQFLKKKNEDLKQQSDKD